MDELLDEELNGLLEELLDPAREEDAMELLVGGLLDDDEMACVFVTTETLLSDATFDDEEDLDG